MPEAGRNLLNQFARFGSEERNLQSKSKHNPRLLCKRWCLELGSWSLELHTFREDWSFSSIDDFKLKHVFREAFFSLLEDLNVKLVRGFALGDPFSASQLLDRVFGH